jgi:hypothetical protein
MCSAVREKSAPVASASSDASQATIDAISPACEVADRDGLDDRLKAWA